MAEEIMVSAAIVTYNEGARVLEACNSILKNTKRYDTELFVFDNASSDGMPDRLEDMGARVLKNGANIGFGAAHNRILTQKMGKYHFVINPDVVFETDVISDMVDFFENNPDVVMAMPKIMNPDGSEQKLPKRRPTFKRLYLGRLFKKVRDDYIWAERELRDVTDIDFCSGCFFCIRSDVFKSLGGFDDRYFMYMEDADLTIRAKQSGRVVIVPQISVTHLWERESANSIKYLFIHIISSFKFLFRWRRLPK